MPAFLFSVIAALIEGQSFASVLKGVTLTQWLTIGGTVLADELPAIAAKIGAKHPTLAALAVAIASGVDKELATQVGHDWLKQNAPEMIPGFAADGSVIDIKNPDAQ
jgi:hypothetical protein